MIECEGLFIGNYINKWDLSVQINGLCINQCKSLRMKNKRSSWTSTFKEISPNPNHMWPYLIIINIVENMSYYGFCSAIKVKLKESRKKTKQNKTKQKKKKYPRPKNEYSVTESFRKPKKWWLLILLLSQSIKRLEKQEI